MATPAKPPHQLEGGVFELFRESQPIYSPTNALFSGGAGAGATSVEVTTSATAGSSRGKGDGASNDGG